MRGEVSGGHWEAEEGDVVADRPGEGGVLALGQRQRRTRRRRREVAVRQVEVDDGRGVAAEQRCTQNDDRLLPPPCDREDRASEDLVGAPPLDRQDVVLVQGPLPELAQRRPAGDQGEVAPAQLGRRLGVGAHEQRLDEGGVGRQSDHGVLLEVPRPGEQPVRCPGRKEAPQGQVQLRLELDGAEGGDAGQGRQHALGRRWAGHGRVDRVTDHAGQDPEVERPARSRGCRLLHPAGPAQQRRHRPVELPRVQEDRDRLRIGPAVPTRSHGTQSSCQGRDPGDAVEVLQDPRGEVLVAVGCRPDRLLRRALGVATLPLEDVGRVDRIGGALVGGLQHPGERPGTRLSQRSPGRTWAQDPSSRRRQQGRTELSRTSDQCPEGRAPGRGGEAAEHRTEHRESFHRCRRDPAPPQRPARLDPEGDVPDPVGGDGQVAGLGRCRQGDPVLPLDRVPGPETGSPPGAGVVAELGDPADRRRVAAVGEGRVVARGRDDAAPVGGDDPLRERRHLGAHLGRGRRIGRVRSLGGWAGQAERPRSGEDDGGSAPGPGAVDDVRAAEGLAPCRLDGGEVGLVQSAREVGEVALRSGAEGPRVVAVDRDGLGTVPGIRPVGPERGDEAGDVLLVDPQVERRKDPGDLRRAHRVDVRPEPRRRQHVRALGQHPEGHPTVRTHRDLTRGPVPDDQHEPRPQRRADGRERGVAPGQVRRRELDQGQLRLLGVAGPRDGEAPGDGTCGQPLDVTRAEELERRGYGPVVGRVRQVGDGHRRRALQSPVDRSGAGTDPQGPFVSGVEGRHLRRRPGRRRAPHRSRRRPQCRSSGRTGVRPSRCRTSRLRTRWSTTPAAR